jgi:hypothetical protein
MSGFKPSELRLPYNEWRELCRERNSQFDDDTKAWLVAWHGWDAACSPMPDAERGLIRYGHYMGWFARRG